MTLLLRAQGAQGPSTFDCSSVVLAASRVAVVLCSICVCKPKGTGELFGSHITKILPQNRYVYLIFGAGHYSGSERNCTGALICLYPTHHQNCPGVLSIIPVYVVAFTVFSVSTVPLLRSSLELKC